MADVLKNATPLKVGQNTKTKEAFQALLQMDQQEKLTKKRKGYYRAYFLSFALPPIGIYYLIKYIFFGEKTPEDIKAGIYSFLITVVTLIISTLFAGLFFKQTLSGLPGIDSKNLQQFSLPQNQKTLQDLYR